ncbi:serine protease [Halobacteriales archaeon QS_1_68_20]|nr:MAG: serine protease [Halobacteriales archaeon QS_1_68_20]
MVRENPKTGETSRRRVLAAITTGAVGIGVGTASAATDRHVVGVDPGTDLGPVREAATSVAHEFDFGSVGRAVAGSFPVDALDSLREAPFVRYVETDGDVGTLGHGRDEPLCDPHEQQCMPWGVDRIDADDAHHDGDTGSDSSVAVVDTGIDPTHEDLDVTGGKAIVTCSGACPAPWADDNGHGTHVAGVAGATNNDVGVVGVAPDADLSAVKVLESDGSGSASDVAAGIEWAADQDIDAINLSIRTDQDSQVLRDACAYADASGSLVVAAAGDNYGGPVGYPGAYDTTVAVSATDRNDWLMACSSTGPEVDLAAPGEEILSTVPRDEYRRDDCTSPATPHVTGAAALTTSYGLSNDEARSVLFETAEDIGLWEEEQGEGLVDAYAAVRAARQY